METHSVANLATLQTPLATFFPSKKHSNLVSENLALPARTHLSLSLSLSVRLLCFSARTPFSHSLSLCVCSDQRAHTSLSLSLSLCASALLFSAHTPLSLSLRLLSFSSASGREEQRFNSVKHRYYVASLILHASVAEITAQLLSLSYVYLISSDDGAIIRIFCAD